jgi:hypothetical protein
VSIQSGYRRIPDYLAAPLALVVSAIMALALAVLGGVVVDSGLDGLRGSANLGRSFLAFFYAAPGIGLLAFVFCFSGFINRHHATSWLTPTFAFALGTILVWLWARGFGGVRFAWYLPGTIAWPVSCWLLHRKSISHSEHLCELRA